MRRIRIVVFGILLAIAATACGDDDDNDNDAAPAAEDTSTTETSAAETSTTYESVDLKVGLSIGSSSVVPLYIAAENGIFEKQGLNVELIELQPPALLPALQSGTIDVATQSMAGAGTQVQAGSDVKCVSGMNERSNFALVARADDDIPVAGEDGATWEDTIDALVGATLAATGPGTGVDSVVRTYYEEAGHSADDFTNVALQRGAAEVAALTTGQIDAALTDYGNSAILEENGGKIVLDFGQDGPRSSLWTCNLMRLDAQDLGPDVGERFSAAMTEVKEYMLDPSNQDAVVSAAQEFGIPDSSGLDDALNRVAESMEPQFDRADVEDTIAHFVSTGQLDPEPEVSVDDLMLPSALR